MRQGDVVRDCEGGNHPDAEERDCLCADDEAPSQEGAVLVCVGEAALQGRRHTAKLSAQAFYAASN